MAKFLDLLPGGNLMSHYVSKLPKLQNYCKTPKLGLVGPGPHKYTSSE